LYDSGTTEPTAASLIKAYSSTSDNSCSIMAVFWRWLVATEAVETRTASNPCLFGSASQIYLQACSDAFLTDMFAEPKF